MQSILWKMSSGLLVMKKRIFSEGVSSSLWDSTPYRRMLCAIYYVFVSHKFIGISFLLLIIKRSKNLAGLVNWNHTKHRTRSFSKNKSESKHDCCDRVTNQNQRQRTYVVIRFQSKHSPSGYTLRGKHLRWLFVVLEYVFTVIPMV